MRGQGRGSLEVKIKGGLITELPIRRLVQEIKFHA